VIEEGRSSVAGPDYLGKAAATLPIITVLSVVVAISYNVIYLFFADVLDVAPLTLADVFSRAWVIVPVLIIFSSIQAGAFLWGVLSGRSGEVGKPEPIAGARAGLQTICLCVGAVLWLVTPVAVLLSRLIIDDSAAVFRAFVGGTMIVNTGMILFAFGTHRAEFNKVLALCAAVYIVIMAVFSTAALTGLASVTSGKHGLVRYGDKHSFCGNVVAVLERGVVVFEPVHSVRKFIPTSEVKSIETPVHCKLSKE
jgi:hypothetical protein